MSMRMSMRAVLFCVPSLFLVGCLHNPQTVQQPGTDIQSFIEVWEQYEELYPLFDHKGIDWKETGHRYFPLAAQCENEDELLLVIAEMLGELEDPSIRLSNFATEEFIWTFSREYNSNYDMDVLVDYYLEPNGWAGWQDGYSEGFGWCDPSVLPYAFMDTIPYTDSLPVGLDSLDAFVAACIENDLPAIILDIRMNPYGDTRYGDVCGHEFMGRFTDHSRPGAIYRSRSGPEYDQYYDQRPAVYPAGPGQYTGTVILLVGENSRNSCESMTANFINFPNVVLVGNTTGGSVSTTSNVQISDLWYVRVVRTTVLTYLKYWIEGAGIPPDIYVEATESDFAAGIDPVLDYAIELLGEYR